jgi:hypothetical protein
MQKTNKQPDTPMAVNWRESERLIWKSKEGREAAIEAAVSTIQSIAWELDDIRKKMGMAVALLALEEKDCHCGKILPSMPKGGGRGSQAPS